MAENETAQAEPLPPTAEEISEFTALPEGRLAGAVQAARLLCQTEHGQIWWRRAVITVQRAIEFPKKAAGWMSELDVPAETIDQVLSLLGLNTADAAAPGQADTDK